MTPTQIAELEAEFIRRARADEAAGDQLNASTWRLAATLLVTFPTETIPCNSDPTEP
jgi:hypothetical protein